MATGLLLLVCIAAVVFAYRWLDPTPVKRIVIATGPDQGAYAEFARRYAPLLKAQGVTLVLRATQGSAENLALLRDAASGVEAAFVQGGVDPEAGDEPDPLLVSLGAVAYEPLWLFYRDDSVQRLPDAVLPRALAGLAGWRINTGPAGGGSGPIFRRIAEVEALPATSLHSGDVASVNGVVDFVQGREDALAFVSAADAPFVQYLLHTPGVELYDFIHADAYARRFAFLHALRLPRGLADPAADRPPQDMRVVAATASLVVRNDLHPALKQLLIQTAARIHGQPGWFARAGEFPNMDAPIFPIAPEAERYYRNGAPWLQRYLPFWLANFADRMWIVLLPLIAALWPLSRLLPPLIELRLRSRVYRWYGRLRAIEDAAGRRPADELARELDAIDERVAAIELPLSYADEVYALRSNIAMVRRRIVAGAAAPPR
ncbi:MAG: C4-dicarboxylate ABC transporter substrate-binding protein [Burkholderiales bacterium]|nr:C4-dicarboxylate ABC transporter substrate-binding protein [Burkholderiales bacterium]